MSVFSDIKLDWLIVNSNIAFNNASTMKQYSICGGNISYNLLKIFFDTKTIVIKVRKQYES